MDLSRAFAVTEKANAIYLLAALWICERQARRPVIFALDKRDVGAWTLQEVLVCGALHPFEHSRSSTVRRRATSSFLSTIYWPRLGGWYLA